MPAPLRIRRLLTTGGVVVALLLGSAATARADFGGPVNCRTDPANPACVIVIGTPGGGGGGGGGGTKVGCKDGFGRAVPCYIEGKGWLGDAYCYYKRAEGVELAAAEALGGTVSPPAYWYVGSCGDATTNFWPPSMTTFRAYSTNPGVTLLAQQAVKYLNLPAPQIRLNPGLPAPQVVFVPTWLWIEPAAYTVRSATASLAGLSVTAVATPTKVVWSTGDGAGIDCGAGTAWTPGTDPAAASPDCGHIYTTASRGSPSGTYMLRASITWRVTWAGGGTSGVEPALTSTSSVQVRVLESAAVNTSSRK